MGLLGLNIDEEKKKYKHIMKIYELWDDDIFDLKIYFNRKWFDKTNWIVMLKQNGEIIKETKTFQEMDDFLKEFYFEDQKEKHKTNEELLEKIYDLLDRQIKKKLKKD